MEPTSRPTISTILGLTLQITIAFYILLYFVTYLSLSWHRPFIVGSGECKKLMSICCPPGHPYSSA